MKLISKSNKLLLLLLLFVIAFVITGCKGDNNTDNDDKDDEYDYTDLTVRDYVGENGVVTAANPYAAKAGLDVLEAGGNAFDAAVAVSFALGVVEPNASGLGGGGIMVAYDASTGEYVSYNFREFVPGAGNTDAFPNRDADVDGGIKSSGVPTQVIGLLTILDDLGSLSRQQVMAPAINYAENGFPVTPELAKTISDDFYKIMYSKDETRMVFTSDGFDPLKAGETLTQVDLANTLKLISEKGADGFYKGSVADALVSMVGPDGEGDETSTLISYDDLDYVVNNYPIIETPVVGSYRGYDVISATTPSSGGIIVNEALNMLEVYGDITEMDHNSAEYINVVSTAMQLAYGDKRKYIGDSKFVDVPIAGLISKAYAAERWQKFTPGEAYLGRFQGDDDYGNPWPYMPANPNPLNYVPVDYDEHYSTTTFSVADSNDNIVSITQTINYFFGNGLVPEGTGFFMNNQLSGFSFTSTSPSFIEPHKQPTSHIMPTIIMKDGDPFATLGSPGGLRIPSAVLQVIINMIDWDMNIQDAINSPRFYSYAASSTDQSNTSKDLYMENAIPESVAEQLRDMNYNVIRKGEKDIDLYFGGVQGIRFNVETGELHGGADPRRDGKALGY